ncbi:MAG: peptide chain release factor N(5)-glutamine methyltransferase [Staphylococcus sp.]|nr:peptide chain release factor N(5)-glutamine methyltransferase [Staphylococcus sp.]
MTTLRELLDRSRGQLSPLYGDGEARWLLRIVMEHIKGWDQVELALRANDEVSDFIIGRVDEAVGRLMKGEPVQYIYGDTYWHGMTLKVTPDVLIPRPETEELVDIITEHNTTSDLRVLDICTGSGCIAIALAKTLKFPEVTAIDISRPALEVAGENCSLQNVNVRLLCEDALLLSPQPGAYDIIVSNPPYVMDSEAKAMDKNVLDHEPHLALFVPDDDALKFYKAIATFALSSLSDGGRLYFELNPLTASGLKAWMLDNGWSDVELLPDIHAKTRFMIASK